MSTTGSQTFVYGHRTSVRWAAMSTYRGAAILITEDGTEINVGADLQSWNTTHENWGGFLTLAGKDWGIIQNEWGGRLRLATGAEGKFDRPNRSEMPPSSPSSPFRIRIVGNGDVPF